MQPLRYARFWLALGITALAAGLLVALQPGGGMLLSAFGDKVNHAAAFVAFTLWFGGIVEPRNMWRVALALLAYGLAIEVVQGMTVYRKADSRDLSTAGLRHWCRQLEQWLAAHRSP